VGTAIGCGHPQVGAVVAAWLASSIGLALACSMGWQGGSDRRHHQHHCCLMRRTVMGRGGRPVAVVFVIAGSIHLLFLC
jgi:hypothetical protein